MRRKVTAGPSGPTAGQPPPGGSCPHPAPRLPGGFPRAGSRLLASRSASAEVEPEPRGAAALRCSRRTSWKPRRCRRVLGWRPGSWREGSGPAPCLPPSAPAKGACRRASPAEVEKRGNGPVPLDKVIREREAFPLQMYKLYVEVMLNLLFKSYLRTV